MRAPEIDDFVILVADRPEQNLHCGDVGIIRDARFQPHVVYQVEFLPQDAECPVDVLLTAEQFQLAPRFHLGSPEVLGGASPLNA